MKALLSIVVSAVCTLLITRLLTSSVTVGHWIEAINYSDAFARWRLRNGWVGVENEEDLWDYICLTVAALLALPVGVLFHRYIRRLRPKE